MIETKDSLITKLEGVQTEYSHSAYLQALVLIISHSISQMKALVGGKDIQIARLEATNNGIAAEVLEKNTRCVVSDHGAKGC